MNQTAVSDEALGIVDTLTQMVSVLGFHDLSSFLITGIFIIAALALLVSGTVVIIRKRRERLEELTKIVAEIEASKESAKDLSLPSTQKIPDEVESFVAKEPSIPIQAKPQELVTKSVTIEPGVSPLVSPQVPPSKKIVRPVEEKPQQKQSTPPVIARDVRLPKPVPVVVKPTEPPAPVSKPVVEPLTTKLPEAKASAVETIKIAAPALETVVAKEVLVDKPLPYVSAKTDNKAVLGAALKNTRGGFMEKLSRLFSRGADVSDADFEEMEAILFTADIGAKTAQKLLDAMRERARAQKTVNKEFLRSVLKEEMTKILESAKPEAPSDGSLPQVLMFVGVNGAGKTTSIGKLGAQLAHAGKKVLFGAGDTFRAAAVEQLTIWGQRVGAEVVSGKENSDSASVLFEAIEKAKNNHADYVLCDTAGRLHTKTSLMDELKKVHRVVSKAQTGAPHQVFLVIDATMGQNAISQAREFAQATPLTGVVLSKLDGTAKGGVALGIVDELKVPIRYIGIGEQVSDLRDFDAKLFVDALFEEA